MFLNKFSNIYRSSFAVSFWTLVSRLFGYGRDILFAAFLGSGPVAEAFIIALAILLLICLSFLCTIAADFFIIAIDFISTGLTKNSPISKYFFDL